MSRTGELVTELRAAVGDEVVSQDPRRLELLSQDIWSAAAVSCELAVAPASTDALSAAVSILARHGRSIAIRGGGMSYTNGYVPAGAGTVMLDLARMNRVLDIDVVNMTVHVEAGCTWQSLNEQLRPLGLRTPYWGTLSGSVATVGGGLSQSSILFGAVRHGVSAESLVGLRVVLADGRILDTGARGSEGTAPFFRHYGPDLTGLFCGDCGALGIKAEATLRLMQRPEEEDYLSCSFGTLRPALSMMAAAARAGIASELVGSDPQLLRMQLKRASLSADLQTMSRVVTGSGSLLKGVRNATRVALAGRNIVPEGAYVVHLVCEGRSAEAVRADMAAARRIAREAGGTEVENSIPSVMRSMPFPPINNILGPGGERWLPVHGVFSWRDAPAAFEALQRLFADHPDFAKHGISAGFLYTAISANALAIEPVLYWPEAAAAIHAATIDPAILARLPQHAANPEATAAVRRIRQQIIDICRESGAAHLQIGRSYPYRQSLSPTARGLVDALKDFLDGDRRLNAGVLGFGTKEQS